MIIRKAILVLLLAYSYIIHGQTWKPLGPFGSEQYNLKTSAWGGGTGQVHAFAFAPKIDHKGKYDWYCVSPWGGLWLSIDLSAFYCFQTAVPQQVSRSIP